MGFLSVYKSELVINTTAANIIMKWYMYSQSSVFFTSPSVKSDLVVTGFNQSFLTDICILF